MEEWVRGEKERNPASVTRSLAEGKEGWRGVVGGGGEEIPDFDEAVWEEVSTAT